MIAVRTVLLADGSNLAAALTWHDGHVARVPPGLNAVLKKRVGVSICYSRTFEIGADFAPKRPAIWDTREPDETDPRRRVKVGEGEPVLADVVMATISPKDGLWLSGQWINTKPDSFAIVDLTTRLTNFKDWMTHL